MAGQQKLFGDKQPLTSDSPKPARTSLDFFKNPPPRRRRRKKKGKQEKPKRKAK